MGPGCLTDTQEELLQTPAGVILHTYTPHTMHTCTCIWAKKKKKKQGHSLFLQGPWILGQLTDISVQWTARRKAWTETPRLHWTRNCIRACVPKHRQAGTDQNRMNCQATGKHFSKAMINAQIGTWKEVISGGPKGSDVIKSVRCFYQVLHEGTKNILLKLVSDLTRGESLQTGQWGVNHGSLLLGRAVEQARAPTEAPWRSGSAFQWVEISFPP